MNCISCRFAQPLAKFLPALDEDDHGLFQCRRYPPPVVERDNDTETEWAWRWVSGYDWCGEYAEGDQRPAVDHYTGRVPD